MNINMSKRRVGEIFYCAYNVCEIALSYVNESIKNVCNNKKNVILETKWQESQQQLQLNERCSE